MKNASVPQTSAMEMQVRTGSADSNGVLMLMDGELIAILVELSDEIHGDARGRWALENTFGLFNPSAPETFADIEQAWDWVTRAASGKHWPLIGGSSTEAAEPHSPPN